MSSPETTLRPEDRVDQYQVLRLLGRGGMGEVYLARDTRLGRKVALKVITREALGGAEARLRFLREAQLTAQLAHPHIVTIFGAGEHDGCPYVALEYLEGQTLRERLQEERPALRQAARLGRAVADALAEAHRHEILHRDLKPENIVIPADGRLRVLDFGLARLIRDPDPHPVPAPSGAMTTPGTPSPATGATVALEPPLGDRAVSSIDATVALDTPGPGPDLPAPDGAAGVFETTVKGIRGTPAYMAPEQWREESGTGATDVWALGLILHEIFSGKHPLAGAGFHQLCLTAASPDPLPSLGTAAPGLPPSVIALVDRCLAKDAALRPAAREVAEALEIEVAGSDRALETSPFRGLLPFTERHAALFFGRDAEIASFLERLRDEAVLPVVGASGSGKSSFVQAGVIPRLREQGPLLVLRLRPGAQPFEALAARLLGSETLVSTQLPSGGVETGPEPGTAGERRETEAALAAELREQPERLAIALADLARGQKVLLLVDQLEELHTLSPPGPEAAVTRQRFMQALAAAADDPAGPVRVILTLRDDFLGRLAEGPAAQRLLARVAVLRTPGPEALREILERPVAAAGFRFEDPELPALMVAEVKGEAAALPLLQFAAERLWERRDVATRLLTRAAYQAIGGVAGALAQHADGILDGLSPAQERVARPILLRLVTPEGTRQVCPRSQLLSGLGPDAPAVLERLTAERAVLTRKGRDEAELELAHESLITAWGRLARWLEESHEERQFLAEVGQAAALWERRGRPLREVWQGEALLEADRRARRCEHLPGPVERFLAAGRDQARRGQRRTRVALGSGAAVLLAITAAALIGTVRFRETAREARRGRSEARTQRAEALRQGAAAELAGGRAALAAGDPFEARARLRAALEQGDSRPARALYLQLGYQPLLGRREFGLPIYTVSFSPDGRTVAASCGDHGIHLIDARTATVRVLRGHRDKVFAAVFSRDGRTLASGSWDGEVRLWSLPEGTSRRLLRHPSAVNGVAFSPGGETLASAGDDTTVRLWDLGAGRERAVLRGHTAGVTSVAFAPGGGLLATGSTDHGVRLWDAASGRERAVLRGHAGPVSAVAFAPGGDTVASSSEDRTIRLWDVASGRERAALRGHTATARGLAFAPDGKVIVSASDDQTVRLWDARTGAERAVLRGHDGAVNDVAFSPGGRTIATASDDQTVRLWDPRASERRATSRGHAGPVQCVGFGPDGRTLASGGNDKTVHLWDVRTGAEQAVLRGHESNILGVTFSPAGDAVASASYDWTARVWDVKTRQERTVLRGHESAVLAVAYAPTGDRLASAGADRTVRLWDVTSGRERTVLRGHDASVWGLAFAPDGRLLASGSEDRTVRLWDLGAGRERVVLRGHDETVWGVAFAPDGRLLASGSEDRTVRVWDPVTGQGRVLGRHDGRVYWLQVHPDGRRVGAPDSSGVARIWPLAGGSPVDLRGHHGEVNVLRFSPDGRLAATSSDDGTVRLWESDTGRPVWRAPLLRPGSLELCTHEGWRALARDAAPRLDPAPAAWRTAVADRARTAAESAEGHLCLATHDQALEIWDVAADRRLAAVQEPGLEDVVAVPGGCVTLARSRPDPTRARTGPGPARRFDRRGAAHLLLERATAIGWDSQAREILVAGGRQLLVLGPEGAVRQRFPVDVNATAVARVGDHRVVGYRDGNLELLPRSPGAPRPGVEFEKVPASPVLRLVAGPGGTVAVGWASGLVALHSLDTGHRLDHVRIHGPVVHLVQHGPRLLAASALGDRTDLDLGVFFRPYCELMREVWRRSPVIWESGLPRLQHPPAGHRCRR